MFIETENGPVHTNTEDASSHASASTASSTSIRHHILPISGHRSPPLSPIPDSRLTPWSYTFPRVYSHLYTLLWDRNLHKRTRIGLFEVRGHVGSGTVVLAVLMYQRDIDTWPELEGRFLACCRQYWKPVEPPLRYWWVEEVEGKPPSPPVIESSLAPRYVGGGSASSSLLSFASVQSKGEFSSNGEIEGSAGGSVKSVSLNAEECDHSTAGGDHSSSGKGKQFSLPVTGSVESSNNPRKHEMSVPQESGTAEQERQ
ncbi:MAG: hypothetical protein LQ340_000871 [Diploschistes diacapsis]|nr:MAG: hypothetical protein LQ340_000871 [Diploschistes diacapsis]